ncbi:MAG: N-acyl homoserine lactonase family protein [Candidatus Methylomirabilota bacterium]
MASWTITMLDTGTQSQDKGFMTYLTGMGQPIKIPVTVALLEGPEKILVDTSFLSVERTWEIRRRKIVRAPEQELLAALAVAGARREEITTVVLTHLHYDHAGNNQLFPQARFLVQREELRYALAPSSFDASAYFAPSLGIVPDYLGTRFELLDGDTDIAPGVRVITTPGHTPGHQSVLVETAAGRYCVAGDAVMWHENLTKRIPPGLHTSMLESLTSLEKIARMAEHVLPGHEPLLFAHPPARFPEAP